jgi:septal ring factor EnvC (AmiA/AmiB activator)
VCKDKEKRICEKCNDETNHSEPWKCPTCKNKKSDKSEYVNSCFKLHQHLQSIEKAEEYLKKDKETILRDEKEIERLLTEVSRIRKKMQDVENKLQQREKDTKRYSDDCFVLFKKLKK